MFLYYIKAMKTKKGTIDIKINNLTKIVSNGFASVVKQTDDKIDGLARIMHGEFVEMREEMNEGFLRIDKELENLNFKIEALRLDIEKRLDAIEKRLGVVETLTLEDYRVRLHKLEAKVFGKHYQI